MIGECAVQFFVKRHDLEQILDALDLIDAHGVGVVHHHFRLFVKLHKRPEELGVFCRDVVLRHGPDLFRRFPLIGGDQRFDICDPGHAADGHCLCAAQFEAVPFAGVVGGSDHDPAIGAQFSVGMITHGSGAEPQIHHICTLFGDSFGQRLKQGFGVWAHISADHHFFRAGEGHKRSADLFRDRFVQLFGIDPANVISLEDSRHLYFPFVLSFLLSCFSNLIKVVFFTSKGFPRSITMSSIRVPSFP